MRYIRLTALLLLAACGDGGTTPTSSPTPPTPVATSITLSATTLSLASLGETSQLTATVKDQNGATMSGASVTWSSSSASVATVSSSGLVTSVADGTATITATSGSANGTAAVTVAVPASLELSDTLLSFLALGDTTQLTATVKNAAGSTISGATVAWTTSDSTIATVSDAGLVTSVADGTATLTATSGSASGTASVTVLQVAASVVLSDTVLSFSTQGDTTQLTVTVKDANDSTMVSPTVSWTTSDTTVATVSDVGLVTSVADGTATVTATSGSASDTASVTVAQVAASIVLSDTTLTFSALGDTTQLTVTVKDANDSTMVGATVTWATSDTTVATVSDAGLVTAISPGTANITATHQSLSATAAWRVNSRNPTIVSLRANRYATEVGRPLTLIWQVTDPDAGEALTCTINIDNAGAAEVTYTNCADSTQAPITYASSGTHRVLFTASDGLGGVATDTLSIQVGAAATLSTGMNASVVLSAFGFNNARDGQTYNHNGGMASDGTRFFLADRNNNRVLAWNTLPTSDVAPDYVLGQTNFTANDPGTTLDKLNWPTALSIAGGKLLVADAYNDRILVWNTIPTTSGAAADFALTGSGSLVKWPWGVWTDGTRIAATSTKEGKILVWNTFPTGNTAASVVITNLGSGSGNPTPRSITSNGTLFSVADHNPPGQSLAGNHFWTSFPTANVAPDFFAPAPADPQYAWMQGDFSGSKLLLFGRYVWIYNSVPATASAVAAPSLTVKSNNTALEGGDGSDLKIFGGKVYVSMSNGNRVVGYNSVPTADREPDFVIGSPSLSTNTLLTNFLITNPNPASDGRRLFVTSDFDRKLYVWRAHPTASGTLPDATFSFRNAYDFQPRDNTLFGDVFMAAGETKVAIWRTLPTNGENPTTLLSGTIGNVTLTSIQGIAYDGRYTYITITDGDTGSAGAKLYIWAGIPTASSNPEFNITIGTNAGSGRITSDGTNVAWVGADHKVSVCQVASLSGCATPQSFGGVGALNLPEDVQLAAGRVFVADTGFNRVKVWNSLATALANSAPDAILGQANSTDVTPRIGQDKLFWPGNVMYDGRKVWVGEFKFSGRLVGYPIR